MASFVGIPLSVILLIFIYDKFKHSCAEPLQPYADKFGSKTQTQPLFDLLVTLDEGASTVQTSSMCPT